LARFLPLPLSPLISIQRAYLTGGASNQRHESTRIWENNSRLILVEMCAFSRAHARVRPDRRRPMPAISGSIQKLKRKCAHIWKTHEEGDDAQRYDPATRLCVSASMTAIGRWLEANRYEPIRYKYDHNEHAVLVTVDLWNGIGCRGVCEAL
jgi:hypothetical protein